MGPRGIAGPESLYLRNATLAVVRCRRPEAESTHLLVRVTPSMAGANCGTARGLRPKRRNRALGLQCSCPAVMEWHRRRNVLGAVHYSFLLAATGLTIFSSFSVRAMGSFDLATSASMTTRSRVGASGLAGSRSRPSLSTAVEFRASKAEQNPATALALQRYAKGP